MPYMVTFTINIPQMLAYIPYMDPMGYGYSQKVLLIMAYLHFFGAVPPRFVSGEVAADLSATGTAAGNARAAAVGRPERAVGIVGKVGEDLGIMMNNGG